MIRLGASPQLAGVIVATSIGLTGCAETGWQPGEIGLGTLGGAAAGGVVGSQIGEGTGRTLSTVGGALLGGALGNVGVDRPVEERRFQRSELARERELQRQLEFERQSALRRDWAQPGYPQQGLAEVPSRQQLAEAPGAVTSADIVRAQRLLRALGYYEGPIDGIQGPATERAIRQFQAEMNEPQTGVVTQNLIADLRASI